MAGMKYKDIAEKYGTTMNTVKSWKKRYGWDRKKGAHKNEKGCTQNMVAVTARKDPVDDGTKETLQNEELTPEQQMFCVYYIRTFNAAQSYQKAYGCTYDSARAHGYELLRNVAVRNEIERLKEIKRQQIVAGAEDIVELQMRIAFSDIGNYGSFNAGGIKLKDSGECDTQLIKEVKETQTGVSVKLEDKQKAIDWLSKYFLMHPDDRYKAEFDKKRADLKEDSMNAILENMQTITDIMQHPVKNRDISDYEGGA